MNHNQLTVSEIQISKILDRRDIRIRIERTNKNHSKYPLIANWTKYYSEPWTISRMLELGYNWGIRTGKKIGDYYFIVLDLDDFWAKERMGVNIMVLTNQGLHYYLLIKELPKSCWLVNQAGQKLGEIHSLGRQVVGVGSIHETGIKYRLYRKNNAQFNSLKFANLMALQKFLTTRNIFTTPWGKIGRENIRNLELYPSKPQQISPAQKYFQKKCELEKQINNHPQKENLHVCYLCLVYFAKQPELIKAHLADQQHQQNWQIYQQRIKKDIANQSASKK